MVDEYLWNVSQLALESHTWHHPSARVFHPGVYLGSIKQETDGCHHQRNNNMKYEIPAVLGPCFLEIQGYFDVCYIFSHN